MAAFRLRLPPSSNDLVRPALLSALRCDACGSAPVRRPIVRLVATAEAKDFRQAAHRRLPVAPVEGPVEVFATFYVSTVTTDCDNRIKSLLDAAKGRLFWDDCQVAELHITKVCTPDESKVGVVFEVRPAAVLEHPELARRLAASQGARDRAQAKLFNDSSPVPTVGGAEPRPYSRAKPTDAPGAVSTAAGRVVLPESLQQRLNRMARPAVVQHRPDDTEGT